MVHFAGKAAHKSRKRIKKKTTSFVLLQNFSARNLFPSLRTNHSVAFLICLCIFGAKHMARLISREGANSKGLGIRRHLLSDPFSKG